MRQDFQSLSRLIIRGYPSARTHQFSMKCFKAERTLSWLYHSLATGLELFQTRLWNHLTMDCLWLFLLKSLDALGTIFRTKLQLFRINASIHYGKILKRLSTEEHLKMLFLPPYHPELAPVETVFVVLKAKIKKTKEKTKWDFQKTLGKKMIITELSDLRKEVIHKIWIRVIKVAKSFILKDSQTKLMTFHN